MVLNPLFAPHKDIPYHGKAKFCLKRTLNMYDEMVLKEYQKSLKVHMSRMF